MSITILVINTKLESTSLIGDDSIRFNIKKALK